VGEKDENTRSGEGERKRGGVNQDGSRESRVEWHGKI